MHKEQHRNKDGEMTYDTNDNKEKQSITRSNVADYSKGKADKKMSL